MTGIKIQYRVRSRMDGMNRDREAAVAGLSAATVDDVAKHLRSLKEVLDPDLEDEA